MKRLTPTGIAARPPEVRGCSSTFTVLGLRDRSRISVRSPVDGNDTWTIGDWTGTSSAILHVPLGIRSLVTLVEHVRSKVCRPPRIGKTIKPTGSQKP